MSRGKSRAIAWIISGLMLLVAVFGIGGGKIREQYQRGQEAFFSQEEGLSPYLVLMECREYAYNLLRLGEKVLPQWEPAMQSARTAWNRLDQAQTPGEYKQAYQALEREMASLYQALLQTSDITQQYEKMARRQYTFFQGEAAKFSLCTHYQMLAAQYNQLCQEPLAGLLSKMTQGEPLPMFSGGEEGAQ